MFCDTSIGIKWRNDNAVPTTYYQDALALLVSTLLTKCQRLVDNLLKGCWIEQTWYKLLQQLFIFLQFNNVLTSCEEQQGSNLRKWQVCYKAVANTSCWQDVRFLHMYTKSLRTFGLTWHAHAPPRNQCIPPLRRGISHVYVVCSNFGCFIAYIQVFILLYLVEGNCSSCVLILTLDNCKSFPFGVLH